MYMSSNYEYNLTYLQWVVRKDNQSNLIEVNITDAYTWSPFDYDAMIDDGIGFDWYFYT